MELKIPNSATRNDSVIAGVNFGAVRKTSDNTRVKIRRSTEVLRGAESNHEFTPRNFTTNSL